ncbi:Olfactory receptor-like protein [Trichinella pseudospiralis]
MIDHKSMEISVSQAHRYNSVPLHKYAIIKTFTPFIQKSNYNYATMILPKIILALKILPCRRSKKMFNLCN